MKHRLLLLLLTFISASVFGQSWQDGANGVQFRYVGDKREIRQLIKSPQPPYGVTDSLAKLEALINKKDFLSTGLIDHAALSATVGQTTFNISAGRGVVANFNNHFYPSIKRVTITAKTGITPAFLTTGITSYIAIDSNDNVVQSASPFTDTQSRDLIILGAIIHSNLTNINAVNNIAKPIISNTNQLHDLYEAVGALNTAGNKYTANGANLNIDKSAGNLFKLGVNFVNDWKSPSKLTLPLQTALTFRYRTQTGVEGSDVTSISPGFYDVAGTVTAIPGSANQFTIQRITIFQSGLTRIQYGQNLFANKAEAIAALGVAPFVTESNIAENGIFRAYLVVRANATALNDLAQAEFIEVGKFGSPIGNAGGAVTSANIIAALGYTPENVANKQNSLNIDGSGVKYPTIDAVNTGLNLKPHIVKTISELTSYNGAASAVVVRDSVRGGVFVKSLGAVSVDDGVVFSSATAGVWLRQYSGQIHTKWYGVDNTGTTDAASQLRNIIKNLKNGSKLRIDPGIYKLSTADTSVNYLETKYGDPGTNFQSLASMYIYGKSDIEIDAFGAKFNCDYAGMIIYRGNNVNWKGGSFQYLGSNYPSEPFGILSTRSVSKISYVATNNFMRNIVQSRNLISSIEYSSSKNSIYFNFYSTGEYDINSGDGYVRRDSATRMLLLQNRSYNGQTGNYYIERTDMLNNLSVFPSSLEVNPGGSPAVAHIYTNQGRMRISGNQLIDSANMNSRNFGYGIIMSSTGGVFNVKDVIIENNTFDGVNYGIGIFGVDNARISGNTFKRIWTTAIVGEPGGGNIDSLIMIDNNVFGSLNPLSTKTTSGKRRIGGINIYRNFGLDVKKLSITNNEFLNTTGYSIYTDSVKNYFISGNRTLVQPVINSGNGLLLNPSSSGLYGINKVNPENVLDIEGEANGNISLTRFGNAPVISASHANGTKIAPTKLLATNTVSSFNAVGYNGSNYVTVARLGADVVSDFTGSLAPVSVFIDQTSLIDATLYRPWYTDGRMRSTFSDKPKNTLGSFTPTASINSISHGNFKPIFDGYDSLFVRKIRFDYDGTLTSSSGGSLGKNLTIRQTNSASYPSLGIHSGGLSINNSTSGLYGIDMGIHNTSGNVWIQAHRNNGVSEAFDVILQPSGGKVGVGNTSPAEALDVTGNATVSGSLTASTYNGSATLTGTPTSTTPTAGDNSTKIATTAFVQNALNGGGTTPTISVTGAGTGATININGNNVDGVITITAGTSPSAMQIQVTFSGGFSYPVQVTPVVSPFSSPASTLGYYLSALGNNTFTISQNAAATGGGTYNYTYHAGGF